jgi:hypothetical protein
VQLIVIWESVKWQTLFLALLKFKVYYRKMIFRDCGILWLHELMCCLVGWTDEWVDYFGLLKGWEYVLKSIYWICGLFWVDEGMSIYFQVLLLNIRNDFTRLTESLFLIQNAHPGRVYVSMFRTLLSTNDTHSSWIQESLDL